MQKKQPYSLPIHKAIGIFILVAFFLCYEMAVQVSPGVMTHELMRDLDINAAGLGLMSGCYFYTYTLMQIPAGLLYDRFSVRNIVLIPLLTCAIGAALFGLSHSVWEAALARLLMGLGSAFAFIGVLVVAADVFPKKHFALLAGLTQMLAAFGAMVGELPLVPLIAYLGWRHTMLYIAIVGFILAVFIWLFVRYKKVCSQTEIENLPNIKDSLKVISKNPQTWWIAIYACCLWAAMATFASLWGIPFLTTAYSLNHASAAGLISFMWLGIALCSPLLGWWSDFIANRKMPLIVSALVGLVCFTLVLFNKQIPVWSLGVLIFLAGGACAGQALSFAAVRENNTARNRATAIGFNNMAVVIAGALFQPLVGKLIQGHWDGKLIDGIPVYSTVDYQIGLSTIAICFLLGSIVSIFFIKETGCKQQH